MIDFTNCKVNRFKAYGGANGGKINIRYAGKEYMLKFPPIHNMSQCMSYTNGCISEYVACHIYETLNIPVQETLLGTYTDKKGRQKVVVACRDFTENDKRLIEFAQLKNTCIDSVQHGYGTDLDSILTAIEEQTLIMPQTLRDFFWDMFIADAFLGNFDRHNGNWGILVDEANQTAEIAPVYDCGSCLYPQISTEEMRAVLINEAEIVKRIFVFPNSAIRKQGKKLSYFDYISSLKNPECNAALKRIAPRIDLGRINDVIDKTPFIDQTQKEFYAVMLRERKTRILDYSLKLLTEREQCCNSTMRESNIFSKL